MREDLGDGVRRAELERASKKAHLPLFVHSPPLPLLLRLQMLHDLIASPPTRLRRLPHLLILLSVLLLQPHNSTVHPLASSDSPLLVAHLHRLHADHRERLRLREQVVAVPQLRDELEQDLGVLIRTGVAPQHGLDEREAVLGESDLDGEEWEAGPRGDVEGGDARGGFYEIALFGDEGGLRGDGKAGWMCLV